MAGVFQERVEQELAISRRVLYYWNHRHQIFFRPYWSVALRFIFLCFFFYLCAIVILIGCLMFLFDLMIDLQRRTPRIHHLHRGTRSTEGCKSALQ